MNTPGSDMEAEPSWPRNLSSAKRTSNMRVVVSVLCMPMAIMVRVRTIDTASFKTLSPKTRMYKVLSTSSAWKMASVATGSTAEMSEPKTKLRLGLKDVRH